MGPILHDVMARRSRKPKANINWSAIVRTAALGLLGTAALYVAKLFCVALGIDTWAQALVGTLVDSVGAALAAPAIQSVLHSILSGIVGGAVVLAGMLLLIRTTRGPKT